MEYEILPHTADLRIRAQGKTLQELFRNSLRGITSVMQPSVLDAAPQVEREIAVSAIDTSVLLADFLSEALSSAQVNREAYGDIIFEELSEQTIKGKLRGVPVEKFEKDIKAVTYHGIEVKKEGDIYEVTVIYDI